MKVVIAEHYSDELNRLIVKNNNDWKTYTDAASNKQEFIDRIGDATVASGYSVVFDEEVFRRCPNLKYLAIAAVGAGSYVDMDAAVKYGVTVMNCPGYNSRAVAETAIGLMISLLRSNKKAVQDLQKGLWNVNPGSDYILRGRKIALVGYGNIGKTIEELLSSWGNTFLPINSKSTDEEIDKTLAAADIVVICCPLTDKTKGMIDTRRIHLMKPSAVLINVARGAIVDEDALFDVLSSGKLFGAGLDVFMNEPGSSGEAPDSIKRFVNLNNVICSSHIAGSSEETRVQLGQMIYQNILSALAGNPTNVYK